MPIGILEVDAAPIVPMVDLTGFRLVRIGPVRQMSLLDAPKDLVELRLADQEGIMLGLDVAAGVHEIQGQLIADRDESEGPKANRRRHSEDLAQEQGR